MSATSRLPALVRVVVALVIVGVTPLLAVCDDDDDRTGNASSVSGVGGDESGEDRNPDDASRRRGGQRLNGELRPGHLRSHSTDNLVLDNEVSDTGTAANKFGEGVYIGSAESNWCEYTGCEPDRSDGNRIEGNDISGVTSEAIDIKEGTVDGVVLDNVIDGAAIAAADSWIDVKGNAWVVAGNRLDNAPEHGIQTHEIIKGWGSGNAFVGNELEVDADGYGFDMHGPDGLNLIACDNEVDGAGGGFANEECR